MENAFEVCKWLVIERPDILAMANQMANSLNTPLDSPPVNITTTTSQTINPAQKSLARLWQEEIMCLFLRCRVPPDEAIESLVKEIFKFDLFTKDAGEVICHSKRTLTDFRSKLNKKLSEKACEFKEIRSGKGFLTAPSRSEIEEFISQDVVEKILFRYLPGTNKNKLKKCGTMEKLALFVRKAINVHFTTYDIEGVKELDNITINCKMLSRSSKDIASKLRW